MRNGGGGAPGLSPAHRAHGVPLGCRLFMYETFSLPLLAGVTAGLSSIFPHSCHATSPPVFPAPQRQRVVDREELWRRACRGAKPMSVTQCPPPPASADDKISGRPMLLPNSAPSDQPQLVFLWPSPVPTHIRLLDERPAKHCCHGTNSRSSAALLSPTHLVMDRSWL